MNKIFDCFMFNNEEKLLEIRFNVLNKFVDHFVIIESEETHSGNKKKPHLKLKNIQNLKKKLYIERLIVFQQT